MPAGIYIKTNGQKQSLYKYIHKLYSIIHFITENGWAYEMLDQWLWTDRCVVVGRRSRSFAGVGEPADLTHDAI
jgi:hypothetical protein